MKDTVKIMVCLKMFLNGKTLTIKAFKNSSPLIKLSEINDYR